MTQCRAVHLRFVHTVALELKAEFRAPNQSPTQLNCQLSWKKTEINEKSLIFCQPSSSEHFQNFYDSVESVRALWTHKVLVVIQFFCYWPVAVGVAWEYAWSTAWVCLQPPKHGGKKSWQLQDEGRPWMRFIFVKNRDVKITDKDVIVYCGLQCTTSKMPTIHTIQTYIVRFYVYACLCCVVAQW